MSQIHGFNVMTDDWCDANFPRTTGILMWQQQRHWHKENKECGREKVEEKTYGIIHSGTHTLTGCREEWRVARHAFENNLVVFK